MDGETFVGTFEFAEVNTREVYEVVHKLTLRKEGEFYRGILERDYLYGYKNFSREQYVIKGTYNEENGVLELEFQNRDNSKSRLFLRYLEGKYSGKFTGHGDRWEKFERL